MELTSVLNVITLVSGTLPILAALVYYKRLDKVLRISGAFFFVSALFDYSQAICIKLGVVNDLPALHLFIVISILFFAAIYYYTFFIPLLKKTVIILSSVALLCVILNVIFIEGMWEYPSNANTILSILLIIFSLAYFYQLLNRQEFIHIEKIGFFWINSGVLLYFAINIFLFMLLKRIIRLHQQQEYYMIHIITNIIANILYTVGLLCKPQKTT